MGITLETPELSVEEKVEVMKLQNQVLKGIFIPIDNPSAPDFKIDKEIERKSPSQRLRDVMYVWYTQQSLTEDFNDFYRKEMERLIEHVKGKLHD